MVAKFISYVGQNNQTRMLNHLMLIQHKLGMRDRNVRIDIAFVKLFQNGGKAF